MRSENKLFNFIILQSLSRKADANINSSFELFHGKGDRLVVSAGKRIKGKYCWQPEKKV